MEKNDTTNWELIYQQTWYQYNVYYQSYLIYNSKFNTIGVVASVFIVVLLTIATSWSFLLYIPIIGLIIPFILTLINLKYDDIQIPWLDKNLQINMAQTGETEFYEKSIDDVVQATNTLLTYKRIARKRIAISIWSIVFSLVVALSFAICEMLQPVIC